MCDIDRISSPSNKSLIHTTKTILYLRCYLHRFFVTLFRKFSQPGF